MSETGCYALWLMPAGATYDRLARVIFELSHTYEAPFFEPHVTLLANILGTEDATVSQCHRLAAIAEPYSIQLTRLDQLNEYYRSVFLRVLETDPVLEANSKAREVFGLHQGPPYMPHLSLLYGNLAEVTKHHIIQSLVELGGLEFYVDRIHLIDGRGGPRDWRKVEGFVFESNRHCTAR